MLFETVVALLDMLLEDADKEGPGLGWMSPDKCIRETSHVISMTIEKLSVSLKKKSIFI
ncbi:MAG: hypothetical protein JAZ03_09625 [Candidatus Thiodiazotropha taylori]|nr:hypothetical protein [Candidatus Thiodiazotropha taylori]MCG8032424.1 hypothetical protein [Candidatus Thiodiazotropha taylori]MCW4264992.1 hypothetical protein [Candidatus Thiodiazotropha endolucinida]MCW4334186.1 hypothetical protein [Candidatus Thiodiazotropha endolucinida]